MARLSEVVFLSQVWAEAYLPRASDVIISITDSSAPPAALNDGWFAALRLCFDDVDPMEMPWEAEEQMLPIQAQQANSIATFVKDNMTSATTLVVHCKYGQSRSAGVAKAIAAHYGLPFPTDYRYANEYVYNLVLHALRQQGEA